MLKNGHVFGRAKALATGTALAGGNAMYPGSPSVSGGGISPSDFIDYTKNSSTSGSYNSKSSSSSSSSSSSKSSSSSSSDDSADTDKFDWIEVAIDRIERGIDKLKNTAESAYKALKGKFSATVTEIALVNNEIALQEKAYTRYLQEANSVGLSSGLAEKVRNGTINISEYGEDTKELIDDYENWYSKALDCSDAIDDLHETLASLYEDNFNNIADDFENKLSLAEHLTTELENGIDLLEAKGYLESTKYYSALQDIEKSNISTLKTELSDLGIALSQAMSSGEIEKYSDSWYSMQEQINSVKEEISEANIALEDYSKTMREIEWGYFDYSQERISKITEEAEFLIDLLSSKDLHTDKGQFTDEGLSTLGLHSQNYNVNMSQADDYAKELESIEKQLSKDSSNIDLIERKEELLGLQQDSILAAEQEKETIISLVKDGIDLQLESLQDLIGTYSDALDNAKTLFDYQQNIEKQTSNISSLQKQLSAYENDFSEETKSKVQQLTVELAQAEKDLAETEYEQYIADQKKLLDELYLEYETILNQRLDNVDLLMSEMIDSVNSNAGLISDTLESTTNEVGYTLTSEMQSIWNSATSSIGEVVSKYGDNFSVVLTTIKEVLDSIKANTSAMVGKSDKEATTTIKNTSSTTTSTASKSSSSTTSKSSTSSSTSSSASKSIRVGSKINAKGAKIYDYVGDTSGETQTFAKDPIYNVLEERSGYLKVRHHKLTKDTTGWFKKSDVKAYKTGGLADYTGLAQLDGTPNKPELVLNAKDTENFIALKDYLREISAKTLTIGNGYGNIASSLDIGTGLSGIVDVSKKISELKGNIVSQNQTYSIGDVNINVEGVADYNEFMNELKKDADFEKMIGSITVDKLAGKSSLEKHKYKW